MTTITDDQIDFDAELSATVDELADAEGEERRELLLRSAKKLFELCGRHGPYAQRAQDVQVALRDACLENGLLAERGRNVNDEITAAYYDAKDAEQAKFELLAESSPAGWAPVDLDSVNLERVEAPLPTLGMARTDGLQLIYPAREHSVLGDTESGKTWLALGCVAAELSAGQHVVYVHFEEDDAESTFERLLLLGVEPAVICKRLRFLAPRSGPAPKWIEALCDPAPSLVVLDGVNEAMAKFELPMDPAGVSEFRRMLVAPFRVAGAGVLACDHFPMNHDSARRDAYGTVHKGNALDGARIQLENVDPFGRDLQGRSRVFVTKDRPGHLRAHGRPSKVSLKTFMGTLAIDGADFSMVFHAPTDADEPKPRGLADVVADVVAGLVGQEVGSERSLLAAVRAANHKVTDAKLRAAIDELVIAGRLEKFSGQNGANGYRLVSSAAATPSQ